MVCVVFPIFPCESHISFLNVSIFRRSVLMKPHISAAECSSSSAWNFLTHFNSFPTFPSPPPTCCLSSIPIPSLFISSLCLWFFLHPFLCVSHQPELPASTPMGAETCVHHCRHIMHVLGRCSKEWAAPLWVPGLGTRAGNGSYGFLLQRVWRSPSWGYGSWETLGKGLVAFAALCSTGEGNKAAQSPA